jgi:hypothetical protein
MSDVEATPNQPPPSIPAFTWMGACSPLLIGPMLLLVGVGIFAPVDVLDAWPFAREFTSLLSNNLIWIGNHAESTNYPQVALLIACMTVCAFVWTSCIFFLQSIINYPTLLRNQRQHRTIKWSAALLIVFCITPIVILSLFFAFAIPGDLSTAEGLTTRSRAGLLVICLGVVYGGGLVIGGIPLVVRLLIDLDLRKAY